MSEEDLSQVARMVLDNNLPSHTLAYTDLQEHPEARFVHPDDTRHQSHSSDKASGALYGRNPAVLISTDAAMQMVPQVRQPGCMQLHANICHHMLIHTIMAASHADTSFGITMNLCIWKPESHISAAEA